MLAAAMDLENQQMGTGSWAKTKIDWIPNKGKKLQNIAASVQYAA